MDEVIKRNFDVEAIQFRDDNALSFLHIRRWNVKHGGTGIIEYRLDDPNTMTLTTLEGDLVAKDGDWFLAGFQGKFYVVTNEDYQANYIRNK